MKHAFDGAGILDHSPLASSPNGPVQHCLMAGYRRVCYKKDVLALARADDTYEREHASCMICQILRSDLNMSLTQGIIHNLSNTTLNGNALPCDYASSKKVEAAEGEDDLGT